MITCLFEGKYKAKLRHAVVDSLVIKDNKILLIKRAANKFMGGLYALPGGFMDRDEGMEQSALREVKEETGYDAKPKELFCIVDDPIRGDEDRQNVGFVHLFSPIKKTGKHDKEVASVHWFELDNLPQPQEVAFDHYNIISLYKKYLNSPVRLPIFVNNWKITLK